MPAHLKPGSIAADLAAHLPYLRRYARALTGRQARGDAFTAATLEAILADPAILSSVASPKVALFKAFHAIWTSGTETTPPDSAPLDPLEAKAQERLGRLTPNTREAILLNTMEGFRVEETADIMGSSVEETTSALTIGFEEMAAELRGRVMIIEDEPIIAMDIKSIVTGNGHDVVGIARTYDEALALAKSEKPDLLLADVQLADGSSGIDSANDILAIFPNLPVVFITAYPERLLTGERPEPAFLISKPFTEEQVRLAVSQSLFFASSEILT
ncbi:MAG: response regulator [Pseudomonadota bacterium]